ncbi:MAG: hypothetical protein HKN93_02145 [Acidimicrobiia bacterium]|nr:hypothetical protein [Acidimicrobiia bacterium]
MSIRRFIPLIAAVALAAAACGGQTGALDGDAALDPSVFDELPINPAAGACLAGDEHCADIPGSETPPLLVGDEPDLGADPGAGVSGFVLDGGVSISDVLTEDPQGPVAVSGFVIQNASGLYLCEALAESMPPQCGGAVIALSDLSTVDPDELKTAQAVTWSDQLVTVIGEVRGDTLVVTPLSS